MFDLLSFYSYTNDFMPYGACLMWRQDLLFLHVLSDPLIALAYFSIPLALFHFVRRRVDLKYRWMFLMFAIFIMASGVTHVMNIWTFWDPDYVAGRIVKAVTAVASVATATLLWPITPKALSISRPITLRAVTVLTYGCMTVV